MNWFHLISFDWLLLLPIWITFPGSPSFFYYLPPYPQYPIISSKNLSPLTPYHSMSLYSLFENPNFFLQTWLISFITFFLSLLTLPKPYFFLISYINSLILSSQLSLFLLPQLTPSSFISLFFLLKPDPF